MRFISRSARSGRPSAASDPNRVFTRPFVLSCITIVFSAFSFQVLMPVIPLYVLDVGGSDSQVGLVMGATALTALLLRPLVGYSADRWGRKPLVILGPAAYVVTAALYPLARSLAPLLAVRMVNGIGLSANSTGLNTYVADNAPMARRAEAMGIFGAALSISAALGPFIGFWLAKSQGFNSVFLLSAITGAIGAILGTQIPERWERKTDGPEGRGFFLLSQEAFYPSLLVISLTATFGAVTAYLAVLADKEDIGNPGVFFLVFALTIVVVRVISGRISDRLGRAAVLVPGMIVLAIAMVLIALATNMLIFVAAAVLYGIGFGAIHPTLQAMVVDRAKPGQLGASMGTFAGAFDLGAGGGGAAWGLVVLATGLRGMFAVAALAPLAGLLMLATTSGYRRPRGPREAVATAAGSLRVE